MPALNDQWQAARQLRQGDVANRREQVAAELSTWQQERLAQGVQLRQSLAQMVMDMQTETDLWVAQIAAQRQAQIPPLRQALQDYTEQLQATTQALLAVYQADHQLHAAAQRQQRLQDRQSLYDAAIDSHLDIVQNLRLMQQQVAVDRAGYRQQQAMMRSLLWPSLASYMAQLQTEVEATLTSLTEARQKADAERRRQRQQDRLALSASVAERFNQLGEFRYQLQMQRAQLSRQVWGTESAPLKAQTEVAAKPAPLPAAAVAPMDFRSESVASRATIPSPPLTPLSRSTVLARPSTASPSPPAAASGFAPAPSVSPVATTARAASAVLATQAQSLEEVVYNYLHLAEGARLSEIETELGINRFQAVDALRSLIQRNLVIKQDRTYRIQEEAVL